MSKRAVATTLAALCGVATMMIATLAPAGGDEGVSVRFTVTHGITTLADFGAAYQADMSRCAAGFPCVVPVNTGGTPHPPGAWDDTLSGDLQGTGSYKGSAILGAFNDPVTFDFPFEAYEPFQGTVEGCGTGTFILHNQGNLNSSTGSWWIVPGSGRGDLVGISGNGTFTSGPPGSFAPDNDIGHVRCAKKNS
jgi:hypothetical protein